MDSSSYVESEKSLYNESVLKKTFSSAPKTMLGHSNNIVHKLSNRKVRMICERMLRDQEAALRAEYESALSNKLAEQYEASVRFNLDQVQRRPPPATCMPLGMDAEHHMHQDLVPSSMAAPPALGAPGAVAGRVTAVAGRAAGRRFEDGGDAAMSRSDAAAADLS